MEDVKRIDRSLSFRLLLIGGLILSPLFFQLCGGVFNEPDFYYDTGRSLFRLPLPVSIIAVLIGTPLLARYRSSRFSVAIVCSTAGILLLESLLSTGQSSTHDRLILAAQYLLPYSGLILGQMYGRASLHGEFQKVCLCVVGVIVPFQLLCSWSQGFSILAPYLYFFSVYQHLQYVPLVIVLCYAVAFTSLWNKGLGWRITCIVLLPWIVVYVIASYSMVIMVVFLGFVLLDLFFLKPSLVTRRAAVLVLSMIIITGVGYSMGRTKLIFLASQKAPLVFYAFGKGSNDALEKLRILASQGRYLEILAPPNVTERFKHWRFYASAVFANTGGFLFGHSQQPDRRLHASAHNYYLDLTYNYGFLSVLPLLALLIYTGYGFYTLRRQIRGSPELFIMVFVFVAIFVIDNNLKVGLRQPYSGIFAFFFLGLIQSRLERPDH